jgi:hypothetical protein
MAGNNNRAKVVDAKDDYFAPDKMITRRQFLIEQTLFQAALSGCPITGFMAIEAVDSTAIEHPEWNMLERKPRKEWQEDLYGQRGA